MSLAEKSTKRVVIVGAGPVGCLAALAFARKGWLVDLYEARSDLRLPASKAVSQQRSINLAISSRGIAALQAVSPSAAHGLLQSAIPMRGRMIHDRHGRQESQSYDRHGQCINSMDRALLNEGLLQDAENTSNIRLFFKHKVVAVDFDQRYMTVQDLSSGIDKRVDFHLCIGADGSYSVIRRQLMRVVRMDFQQEYIPHEYVELKMPAGEDEHGRPRFLLDPNHLHIWPRHSFMLIALPNKDKTFTCTLFAPSADLDRLTSRQATLDWFATQFPDALALIGAEKILADFENNPRSPLISTKAKPYHYKDRCIILGDAAHSMVPFYGQGLNCGLEDVRVLKTILEDASVFADRVANWSGEPGEIDKPLATALSRYSESRHGDLVAICKLAMDNYTEMRHSVTTPAYILKRLLDNVLYGLTSGGSAAPPITQEALSRKPFPTLQPCGWLPLYTMVTFRPDISYATAKKKAELQASLLSWLGTGATTVVGVASLYAFYKAFISLKWITVGRSFPRF